VSEFIPYGRQYITQEDIDSVVDVLKSDWLTQGPVISAFESACAEYSDVKYAVAVNSATSALHLACLGLGLGPGDIVWTSPNTFVASSNCALYCGASVDFVDIDEKTYNMSASALAEKLFYAKKSGKLPKILILVHFAGQSCEMKEIKALADQYDIKIIEDASHAIGGQYLERTIGGCQYSDVAIFSFHPVKIITTGEGGMLVTNSIQLRDKVSQLRSHGVTRDPEYMEAEPHGAWYYEQTDLGFNYRITDMQASLGLSQLKKIDGFIARRRILANQYYDMLSKLPIVLPWQSVNSHSAYHLYPIQLNLSEISKSRLEVFNALRAENIGVNVHYIPVHTQPFYQRLGFSVGDFPMSEKYYSRAISLPLYYDLTDEKQAYVVHALENVLIN
jgi:UDP-4-amino-4,6-dideoxy-N-acetyl-beta-L-altrosamine transaminase